jgi:hypothetical protein
MLRTAWLSLDSPSGGVASGHRGFSFEFLTPRQARDLQDRPVSAEHTAHAAHGASALSGRLIARLGEWLP